MISTLFIRDAADLVKVRMLSPTDPDIPDCIKIITARTYEEALPKMVESVQTAPVNTAIWLGPADFIDEQAKQFMSYWCSIGPEHITIPAPRAESSALLTEHLQNTFKKYAALSPDFNKYAHGQAIYQNHMVQLSDAVSKTLIAPSFTYHDNHSAGYAMILEDLHQDTFYENMIENRQFYRLLQTWNGYGTMIADPLDWEMDKNVKTNISDLSETGRQKKPILWNTPPYALTLITGPPWPHAASLHSKPVPIVNPSQESADSDQGRFLMIGELEIAGINPDYIPRPL